MNRLTLTFARAVSRAAAILTLVGLLVGVPIAVATLVDSPWPTFEQLRTAWRTGHVDDDTVVRLGATLFLVLWAWFAVTTCAEAARVIRSRRGSTGRRLGLPPPPPSPTGWIQRLVRLALISTTALASTALRPSVVAGAGDVVSMRLPVAVVAAPDGQWVDTSPTFTSSGRDTPYSVASRLGDPTLRASLIDLNRGRPTPTGAPWVGGVFPAEMEVMLPPGAVLGRSITWTTYIVEPGDSVYAIAAAMVDDDDRRVVDVADQIIARNLGRTMSDGRVFTDPSLILPGWQLEVPLVDVPAAAPTQGAGGTEHVVLAGESYWAIAEDHLRASGSPAGPADVANLVRTLRDVNAPRLGHTHPDMLHPGDVVLLPGDAGPAPTPTPDPTPTLESTPTADAPDVEVPSPDAPAEAIPAPAPPATPAPSPPTSPSSAADTTSVVPLPDETPVVPTPVPPVASAPARPDEPVPGVATPGDHDDGTTSSAVGIAATLLLGAGALAVLEARRRHQLRRAAVGARLEPPTDDAIATETLLRSLDAPERAVRLDLALRSAAGQVCAHDRFVIGALMTPEGAITLLLDAPAPPPAPPWLPGPTSTSWFLPGSITPLELARSARRVTQPCPALVHLGTARDDAGGLGELFIDVEAIGVLYVDGPPAATTQVLSAVSAALAASPLAETLHVVTAGLDGATHLGNLRAESAASLDAALDAADTAIGSTADALDEGGSSRTFSLRIRSTGGEVWEPAVLVVDGAALRDPPERPDSGSVARLMAMAGDGGRGFGSVLAGLGGTDGTSGIRDGAGWVLRHREGTTWTLAPLGVDVVPACITAQELHSLHDLLDAADRPPLIEPVDAPPVVSEAADHADETDNTDPSDNSTVFAEMPWSLLVRVLGQVDVVDRGGHAVTFERSKALELAVWLSQHRERPTRAGARTALWNLDVRDATFANVVSDARRAMARAVPPPDGEEWIERTLTEDLPLHSLVVSDADLLRARVLAARHLCPERVVTLLRPGLELIRDMPFSGSNSLWPDAEGITSSLTLLATGAATELARAYLAHGDIEGVFWSTGQGLKVLYGHEELIALRMRAHASCGDLAGVRNEWEVYERALTADPWSNGEPSPKLVAIRRELLSSR